MKEKDKQFIGYEVHSLDNMIGRMISSYSCCLKEKEELTKMQSWIIGYLYENSDKVIFQKDIEAKFHIARSTATGILKLMEKKGFLLRTPYPSDARLKRMVLTEKGVARQLEIMKNLENIEKRLHAGLSQEELDSFFQVLEKIKRNTQNSNL